MNQLNTLAPKKNNHLDIQTFTICNQLAYLAVMASKHHKYVTIIQNHGPILTISKLMSFKKTHSRRWRYQMQVLVHLNLLYSDKCIFPMWQPPLLDAFLLTEFFFGFQIACDGCKKEALNWTLSSICLLDLILLTQIFDPRLVLTVCPQIDTAHTTAQLPISASGRAVPAAEISRALSLQSLAPQLSAVGATGSTALPKVKKVVSPYPSNRQNPQSQLQPPTSIGLRLISLPVSAPYPWFELCIAWFHQSPQQRPLVDQSFCAPVDEPSTKYQPPVCGNSLWSRFIRCEQTMRTSCS